MKETIVTDIIQLDSIGGINTLRKLYKEKQEENFSANNIQCQYKDFTFTINIDDVNIPLKSAGESDTKIIISKPKKLEFNGQPCRTKDDNIEMTIINNGEELQFENFTFNKQPYDSDEIINKTIFDNIVETGITEAFCYNRFDVKGKKNIEYNFPLHYNAHGIFKIPVNENNLSETINIQGTEYKIDKQSAILFKENTDTSINKKPFEYITIDVADNNGKRRYFDIADSAAGDIRQSKCNSATEMQIQYKDNPKIVIHEPEAKNTPNFFTNLFCCCCGKTNNNKESELNIETLNRFEDIQDIVEKQFTM